MGWNRVEWFYWFFLEFGDSEFKEMGLTEMSEGGYEGAHSLSIDSEAGFRVG